MDLEIRTFWDGRPAQKSEWVKLSIRTSDASLTLDVEAPFNHDPAPDSAPGFCEGLWEYEVVELFLFGRDQRYLELELGPYGHYLALQLHGVRNRVAAVDGLLPTCTRGEHSWQGRLSVPRAALPPGLSSLNAFAIRGRGSQRRYFALCPTPGEAPNFHQLDCSLPFEDNL